MKKTYIIISSILIAIFLYYSAFIHKRIYKKTAYYMDTVIQIQLYYHGFLNASNIMNEAMNDFKTIDSLCGFASKNGDIYNLNKHGKWNVSSYTKSIIDSSIEMGKLTNGYFDITVGAIERQWKHFNQPLTAVPDSNITKRLLKHIGYGRIKINVDSVFLPDSVEIVLGGIAKGYAIDLAYNDLLKHNLDGFLIDAGGDIRVYSKGEKKWTIGIQNPRANSIMGYFKIANGAVVTSGDYERYVIIDGVRYCHLINPKTGFPEHGLASVTVFGPNATRSDAMATALSVMGKDAINFVLRNNFRAILIYAKKDSLHIFESRELKEYIIYEKGFVPKIIAKQKN